MMYRMTGAPRMGVMALRGMTVVEGEPDSAVSRAFVELAEKLLEE